MTTKIKILIVDDHVIVRDGLISLFNQQPDLQVVGEAGSLREAVDKTFLLKPDLVLMDISLPDGNGLEAARSIIAHLPKTKIIILTVHESDDMLFSAISSGAKGYLLKSTPVKRLIASIRAVMHGEAAVSPAMMSRILDEFYRMARTTEASEDNAINLTRRERQVLRLLGRGTDNQQIANDLFISKNTVKNHLQNIRAKLNLRTRRELIKFAQAHFYLNQT